MRLLKLVIIVGLLGLAGWVSRFVTVKALLAIIILILIWNKPDPLVRLFAPKKSPHRT